MKLSENAKLVLAAIKELESEGTEVFCASVWSRKLKNELSIGSVGAQLNNLKKKGFIEVVGIKTGYGNKYKSIEVAA